MLDHRWHRFRRLLGPVTRRIPYGHLVTETATYARLLAPDAVHPDQRFVIFAQGRSGSTLLADLLNSHPRIYCADEPLTWTRRDPARYAAACSVGHRGDTYGFKVKIYQLTDAQQVDPGVFLQRMVADGWRVIHLQRRNVLRQALSAVVAEQRQVYHQFDSSGPAPVRIDPPELLARTAQRVAFCRHEAEALEGIDHLALVYEDDLLDPATQQGAASRVFSYLGLEDVPASTELRKIADRSLQRVVANADEVRDTVASSPYAHLLAEE